MDCCEKSLDARGDWRGYCFHLDSDLSFGRVASGHSAGSLITDCVSVREGIRTDSLQIIFFSECSVIAYCTSICCGKA